MRARSPRVAAATPALLSDGEGRARALAEAAKRFVNSLQVFFIFPKKN